MPTQTIIRIRLAANTAEVRLSNPHWHGSNTKNGIAITGSGGFCMEMTIVPGFSLCLKNMLKKWLLTGGGLVLLRVKPIPWPGIMPINTK